MEGRIEVVHRITKRRRTQRSGIRSKRGADWSSISGDFLFSILEKLDSIEDLVSISSVCKNWYYFAANFYNLTKKPNFVRPYFMLRGDSNSHSYSDSNYDTKFTLCSFDFKSGNKKIVLDLPEADGKQCWGSPFGWLVTFCPKDLQFSLLHPFSRATLSLPSIETLIIDKGDPRKYKPYKAFLTANPDHSPEYCFVLVVFNIVSSSGVGGDFVLVFAKPGDRENNRVWTRIQGPNDLSDIICFKGNLYGVRKYDGDPVLVLIQLQPIPRAVESPTNLDRELRLQFSGSETNRYLVDLNGELCLILRYTKPIQGIFFFRVFKINSSTRKWTQVVSRADHYLYVGDNYTFACKRTNVNLATYTALKYFSNPTYPKVWIGRCLRFRSFEEFDVHCATPRMQRYESRMMKKSRNEKLNL